MPRDTFSLRSCLALFAATLLAAPASLPAQSVDLAITDRIVDEGARRSEVTATAQYLADIIGPRLTNSPGMRKAEAWSQERFRAWGLANVHREGFEFGRGWWLERSSVRMLTPRAIQLTAVPISWTPSTGGPISGPIVFAPMDKEEDFAVWRGKLAGRVVLITRPDTAHTPPAASRQSAEDLARFDTYEAPNYHPGSSAVWVKKHVLFPRALDAFLKAEGALAYATMTRLDGKLVMGDGDRHAVGDTPLTPGVEIAVEDYRRLVRLAEIGQSPTVAIDTLVHYDDSDTRAYNIFADIPGADSRAGYVMAGAHLDSAAAADGASDNAAGVAMVMEAARILAKMPRPKRTIRFALWAGEEQGLLGSMAYVEKYVATRGAPDSGPTGLARFIGWGDLWPVTPLPGWKDLSAYFNLDNGSGKIRGIYAENNLAAIPIFRAWLAPFATMGASTVAIQGSGGSDHYFLQTVGVPSFQFIQDWGDYGRMHHSSMDTFDHLDPADMRQASIILASFLWNAANADPLPRSPLPTRPVQVDLAAMPKN